jgi:tetratricopeptide (TPR) repeat protein
MLQRAIDMDRRAQNLAALAPKYLALAEARMGQGRPVEAADAVQHALDSSREGSVLLPAARMYITLDRPADAQALATELRADGGRLGPAYADMVDAELALDRGEVQKAIDTLTNLVETTDLWLARLILGSAYVQAHRYPEAFAQFDGCQLRRAEAATLFGDNVPTVRYLALLEDWVARARRNVAMTGR